VTKSNAALVATLSQHFIEAGEVMWELVADDVEVHDHDMFDAGQYIGHEGFARWLQDWADAWVEWTIDVHEVVEVDNRVLLLGTMKARGASGVSVERDDGIVYELSNGQVVRLDYFNDQRLARAAIARGASA
jgi:ketosteroid isomerase-like protein